MASRAAATFRRFRAIADRRKSVAGPSYDWDAWIALVGAATGGGVRFRWLRIISEPVSDYIRWEHAISYDPDGAEVMVWLNSRGASSLRRVSPLAYPAAAPPGTFGIPG